jgi:hypothetical protein
MTDSADRAVALAELPYPETELATLAGQIQDAICGLGSRPKVIAAALYLVGYQSGAEQGLNIERLLPTMCKILATGYVNGKSHRKPVKP